MISYYGDYPTSAIVYIPINTFDSNDPSASVTVTNLANTDVHIHKDGGTTQRNNAAGITMTIDYDSITGNHLLIIDTSDNTVADFFQAGHEYQVRVEGITVDGATLNSWVGAFSIERAGGALALLKSATYGLAQLVRSTTPANTLTVDANHLVAVPDAQKVDVNTIKTSTVAASSTVTFANGTVLTTGGTLALVTDITTKTGFSLASTGADLILKSSTFIQAIVAAVNEFATYGLTALNTLLVTTGIKTASFANNAITALSITDGAITNAKVADDVDVNVKTITNDAITAAAVDDDGNFVIGNLTASAIAAASVAISGAVSVGTTTTLTGNVSLGGTLGVTGTTTLTGHVAVSDGIAITGSTAGRVALSATGNGAGQGVLITGGGTNASGVAVIGGASNGNGVYILGDGSGSGLRIDGGDGDGSGISVNGGATDGSGIVVAGVGTGDGIRATSGSGATGNGIKAVAASTNGDGFDATGKGAGAGIHSVGGLTGNGMELTGGGTSGDGLHAKAAGTGHGIDCHGGGVAGDGLHAEADNDGDGIEAVAAGAGNLGIKAAEIAALPTTTEFELRTLPAADYTIVGDLGTVQTGDSFAIVNGDHGLVSIQDDVDSILADTGELQTDLANGGRLDLLIDGIITTQTAVKAKTDSLTFTVAGNVDANAQYVNDTQLIGNGGTTPWGPT